MGQIELGSLLLVSHALIAALLVFLISQHYEKTLPPPSSVSNALDETTSKQILERLDQLERKYAELMASVKDSKGTESSSNNDPAPVSSNNKSPLEAEETNSPDERTIHFIYGLWDSKPMPANFAQNLKSWRKLNPTWKYKVWSKAELKAFWKEYYTEFKPLWGKTRPIQKADISRLMLVHHYGGLYADLDTAPTKPIDDVLFEGGYRSISHNAAVCIEDLKTPEEVETSSRWAIRQGVGEYPTRIANYVFFAKPGSSLMKRALSIAKERVERLKESDYTAGRPDMNNPYAIIYSTGPDVITEATFFVNEKGQRITSPDGVVVLAKDRCHMHNQATGSWIGDGNPASSLSS